MSDRQKESGDEHRCRQKRYKEKIDNCMRRACVVTERITQGISCKNLRFPTQGSYYKKKIIISLDKNSPIPSTTSSGLFISFPEIYGQSAFIFLWLIFLHLPNSRY